MSLRVIFMGTPDFSVPTLMEIVGQGHEVVACYSQPPRPAGRGMDLKKSPVHEAAESFGIPVFTPKSLKGEEEQAAFASLEADVAVVVAYGLLLPKPVLEAPEYGCLNLHASMLPRWRGAAPINRAIMAGDAETAVQVMRMEEGLDTGPVCMSETLAIGENMTAGELHDRLAPLGGDLMVRALAALSRGALGEQPQAEGRDLCRKALQAGNAYRLVETGRRGSQSHSRPVAVSGRLVRNAARRQGGTGQDPAQRAGGGRRCAGNGACGNRRSPVIACGTGAVRLVEVQRAGKKPMSGAEFLRGASLSDGTVLD